MVRRSIEIDVADYIDNDDLVEMVVDRDLVAEVLAAVRGGEQPRDVREIAVDLLGHLMGYRRARAEAAMRELLRCYVPAHLVDAIDAMQAGHLSAAICHVESFVSPRPSADVAHYRDPAPSTTPETV